MTEFFHGVETRESLGGTRPAREAKSAIIGMVCTAPIGPVNQVVLINNEIAAGKFGPKLEGFTAGWAFNAGYDQGSCTYLAINVLDPAIHRSNITDETVTLNATTGIGKTAHTALQTLVVKSNDSAITYTLDQDYRVDMISGKITRIPAGAIVACATLKVDYDYADPTLVTAADVIGETNAAGESTGLQALLNTYSQYGFFAKILIVPKYCELNSVAAEMISIAEDIEAMALIDAPFGTTFDEAYEGRSPDGTINFGTSSNFVTLCHPYCKTGDEASDNVRYEPLSQRLAGTISEKDLKKGYQYSPSNTEIKGITGMEYNVGYLPQKATCQANMLNSVGIVTAIRQYGRGIIVWGNRTAAYPSSTHITNFIPVRRTASIINEDLRELARQYQDEPITAALIDALVENANQYFRTKQQNDVIVGGKAWYDSNRNSPTELSAGRLRIGYKFTPPPPAEHIINEAEVTNEFLLNLKSR